MFYSLVVDFGPLKVNRGDLRADVGLLRFNLGPLEIDFWPVEGELGSGFKFTILRQRILAYGVFLPYLKLTLKYLKSTPTGLITNPGCSNLTTSA